ncbi:peptidylprolyl isomerase [Candidatus Venteria ishoeyi]|uniref:Chaperone SurA n=1 Tax=Candidatus Venteria ishoeyi TaxID=1899563 RepID=A0A1H6FIM1_9GAMM|nr:peptidylprolyl isomerase [Candidatus Venteria ishoeyi]MDM8547876.1 peptidylprolyl isomerase [Candidatus Venteria ishoeyi]SEH08966.1 Chaperone SurA precursor [Candidatus Venteria ishoeyi]
MKQSVNTLMTPILSFPIAVISSLFVLFSLAQAAAENTNSDERLDWIVAVVNDEVITHTALEKETQNIIQQLRQQGTGIPPMDALQSQVLERMILEQLQLQLAEKNGIRVGDNELNDALRNVATQNQLSLASFRNQLEQQGVPYTEFRDEVRKELTLRNLQQRQVQTRVTVTERDIDNLLTNLNRQGGTRQEYHLLHILIALPEAASPEDIADKKAHAQQVLEQLRNGADFRKISVTYSDSRRALEGGDLGWRRGNELPGLFADTVTDMEAGDISELLHNASGFHIVKLEAKRSGNQSIITQTHARHMLLKTNEVVSDDNAEQRLRNLQERVREGQSFEDLAKAHSDDTASAAKGGDLGWVSPGQMVPEFEEQMQTLSVGDISPPFKSRYGWHIIQVLERRQHDNSEQALRSKASTIIRQRKGEEELQNWLRQLRDEAYVDLRL